MIAVGLLSVMTTSAFFVARAAQPNTAKLYISSVTAPATSTPAAPFIMGAHDQPIFTFSLSAIGTQDIKVNQLGIILGANGSQNPMPLAILKNIRLYNGDAQVGATIVAAGTKNALPTVNTKASGYAAFTNLNVTIPKGTAKIFTVKADMANTPSTLAQAEIRASLNSAYFTTDYQPSVVAVDAASGASAAINGAAASGLAAPVYATKISAAYSAMTPTGFGSKSAEQSVAQFVIANAANANNASAQISGLKLALKTTITNSTGANRVIKIYKGQNAMSSALVAATTLSGAGVIGGGSAVIPMPFSQPVAVESGSIQIFTVTMDTVDAQSGDMLSVGIAPQGINWTDGVSTKVLPFTGTVPNGKTLLY